MPHSRKNVGHLSKAGGRRRKADSEEPFDFQGRYALAVHTTTDSRGRFVLSWDSSTTTLAKLYVDGDVVQESVHAGEDVSVRI
jgi:hypothetical protein